MDSWHKILSGSVVVLLIYIVFLQGCGSGRSTGSGTTVIKVDTIRFEEERDTNWYDTTVFKYITVKVPKPYYDTTIIFDHVYTQNDFDQMMSHPSIYEDSTVKDDTVRLYYRATVRGYLDDLELGYKILKPNLITVSTVLETEVTKIKKSKSWKVYIGLDAAANAQGLTHLAPMLELATPKMTFNGGYDLNDQAFVIGARSRISFRKKSRP